MNVPNPRILELMKRYDLVKNQLYNRTRTIYYSVVTQTREGDMDATIRKEKNDLALPVRVAVKRKEPIVFDDILLEQIAKEKRRIYAEEYRKNRYMVKKINWK